MIISEWTDTQTDIATTRLGADSEKIEKFLYATII